ncbi:hypothetical protein [Streptomyces sp. SYSU K217416]
MMLSAVTGAVLLGALMAPPAAAHSSGPTPDRPTSAVAASADDVDMDPGNKCGRSELDISSAVVEYGELQGVEFRTTTDQRGNAFLNDSRNPGLWIDLGVLPGAPWCVVDTAVAVTTGVSQPARRLFVNLLTHDGLAYEAVCTLSGTPFTPFNLAAACAPGFIPVPGTPV